MPSGCERSRRGLRWGYIAVAGLGCLAAGPAPALPQEIQWHRLGSGLAMTVWEPGALCRDEVPPLVMVNVDPERFRFAIYHYRDEGLEEPLTILEWQKRTGATVVVNSGLFREDYSYLGLLLKDGRSLGGRRHAIWQGLFVAEPVQPGLKKAGILDLSLDRFAEDHPLYREAAQSLMLLDRKRNPRVLRSSKQAYQTVIGEDGDGRILIIKTTAEVTLWELAECLRERLPIIRQAMAMDGGSSSDLLIGAEMVGTLKEDRDSSAWQGLVDGSGQRHIPLPSVIGIFPRAQVSPRP